jgi:hypothetical protein
VRVAHGAVGGESAGVVASDLVEGVGGQVVAGGDSFVVGGVANGGEVMCGGEEVGQSGDQLGVVAGVE